MCATCSSVLVLPRSSWCVWAVNRHAPAPPARMRPAWAACRACSSFRACTACRALRGRGLRLRVCGLRARVRCLRACGFACVRVRAAWSSWCARACLRACGVHACGCGVGVRAGVFALARALAVQLTTATLSATGIRKTCSGRVCRRGSSWGFGSGKSRFTKSTSSKSSEVKVVKF